MPYAVNTSVPVERTKIEIEQLVMRRGAEQYMSGNQLSPPRAVIQFRMQSRVIRFELPLPQPDRGKAEHKLAQETRARWRALLLIIKAKLEAVENGVTTFEEEFLAHIVMPGDRTVAEYVIPQIEGAYSSGKLPKLLPQFTEESGGHGR
jgi:hypothetical protein